jgi:hypothetical protein
VRTGHTIPDGDSACEGRWRSGQVPDVLCLQHIDSDAVATGDAARRLQTIGQSRRQPLCVSSRPSHDHFLGGGGAATVK